MGEEAFVFGAFRVLPAQRILLEDGKPLHLGSGALDVVLLALVECAGDTIHKDQPIARTWPDTVVDEGTWRVLLPRCARLSATEGVATASSPTSLEAAKASSRWSGARRGKRPLRCRIDPRLAATSPHS